MFAKRRKIPTNIPIEKLTPEHRAFVIDGEPGYGTEEGKDWPKYWYGVKGFFRWLEKNLPTRCTCASSSRATARTTRAPPAAPRLQPEALCWRWRGFTLPQLYAMPVDRLHELIRGRGRPRAEGMRRSPTTRSSRACATCGRWASATWPPGRPSRTLSGGEVERVNLAGAALGPRSSTPSSS